MRGLNYAGGTIPCPGCGRPISAVIPLTDFREWWLIRELEID